MFYDAKESKKLAYDGLLDVAKHCMHSIYTAPQIDSKMEIKTAILTGEAIEPIVEMLEAIGEYELICWMDAITYRLAMKKGITPVLLLIGADLSKSYSSWDCGACGFPTCKDFNKYSRDNFGLGISAYGPSCMLNTLNFGIASDWACAAASKYNVENRIHTTIGLVANLLEYLEGTTCVLGLSIGPLKELWYYNRPAFTERWDKGFNDSVWFPLAKRLFTVMFQSFSGSANPPIKSYDKWWEEDNSDYTMVFEEPELNVKRGELLSKLMELVPEKRARVEELREKYSTS